MNISTRGRYALRALIHIAESYEKDGNKPVSIKTICGKEKISNRYLENIFVSLRKAGILKSLKGEKGGFMMAREPSLISVFDVLNAVENEMAPSKCVLNIKVCENSSTCGMRTVWTDLNEIIQSHLEKITLDKIAGNSGS
ncbi:MAG: RrF2 family transcriptional regulator [Candidatus Goldiibacteriota bacterium]